MLVSETKNQTTTNQLIQEQKHIEKFENVICPKYGFKMHQDWGSGSENKKYNCDADRTVEIVDYEKFKKLICSNNFKLGCELTVSLKTKQGNFTIANGDTMLQADLFKYMIPPTDITMREEFKKTKLKIKQYQEKFGKNKRWGDEGVGQDKKEYIKLLLIKLYRKLFCVPSYREKLYEWLNSRQSDLKCVGDKVFVPEKKILLDNCMPEILGNNTVIVGHFKLRVKAARRLKSQ